MIGRIGDQIDRIYRLVLFEHFFPSDLRSSAASADNSVRVWRRGPATQTGRVVDAVRAARVNASRCGVEERIQPVVADWRAWPLTGRFGLVLGADILYRVTLHPALRATLQRALVPGGTAMLADP